MATLKSFSTIFVDNFQFAESGTEGDRGRRRSREENKLKIQFYHGKHVLRAAAAAAAIVQLCLRSKVCNNKQITKASKHVDKQGEAGWEGGFLPEGLALGLSKCSSSRATATAAVDNVENDKLPTIIIEHLFRLYTYPVRVCLQTRGSYSSVEGKRLNSSLMTCIDFTKLISIYYVKYSL